MGDFINVLIDDIWALLIRIFVLPLAFQIVLWELILASIWILIFWILGFFKKSISNKSKLWLFLASSLVFVAIGFAAVYDFQKHNSGSANKDFLVLSEGDKNQLDPTTIKYLKPYIDTLKKSKENTLSEVGFIQQEYGLEVIRITMKNPLAVAYIATVDLDQYSVVLDSAITVKELTSTYSKRFNVDIAVNGEAGTTPGFTAPLGQWTGNYIVNGKPIYLKDNASRPFISFDKNMTAKYYPECWVINFMNENLYNTIWGRFDLLRDGKLAISTKDGTQNNPYPRTIVGIDQSGSRVFLMVVDGRNPNKSLGLTMKECGELLLKAGCYHAMACDQGGSSTMFSKKLGVVNRPADGGERMVYTHLGFKKN